jgi:hypothetical protein
MSHGVEAVAIVLHSLVHKSVHNVVPSDLDRKLERPAGWTL